MKALLISMASLVLFPVLLAHGRSEEMVRMLNAPVPEWMSIAEPIKAERIESELASSLPAFRPRSGGATNSRNRVQIPERGIEFQVDYQIDFTGDNAAGRGVSLNPEGTKLIVNSGTTSHLYEITADGKHRELSLRLPHVTYDKGLKGFITGWSWAGNETLLAIAEITDEKGHEIIEGRIYVFHMKEQALARLDLSALNLPASDGIEVISVGDDLLHLKIQAGAQDLIVKADLKSPPMPLSN